MTFLIALIALIFSVLAWMKAGRVEEMLRRGVTPPPVAQYQSPQQESPAGIPGVYAQVAPATIPGVPVSASPAPKYEPGLWARFISWLKEDWLLKLGGLLVFLGIGWLVLYLVLVEILGFAGRISLGLLLGAVFLYFGWRRMLSFVHQGSIFLALGSATVLLTTFAAQNAQGTPLFPPIFALVIMFASAAVVALASLKFRIRSLAVLSVVIAGIVPIFTGGGSNELALWSYLAVVVVGAIWLVAATGWRIVTGTALAVVTCYSGPYFVGGNADEALLFAYLFAAVFFAATTWGIVRRVAGMVDRDDLIMIVWNGLLLLGWVLTQVDDVWKSLTLVFWMLVFLFGAFAVFRMTGRREPFLGYAAVAVMYLGAATAAELEGAALVIAFTLEAAALPIAAYFLAKSERAATALTPLFVIPMALSAGYFFDYHPYSLSLMRSYPPQQSMLEMIFNERFFVLLVLAIALFGVAWFLRGVRSARENDQSLRAEGVLAILGALYALRLYWITLFVALPREWATFIALLTFTMLGLALYRSGMLHEKKSYRAIGGALIGFVAYYLLFVVSWRLRAEANMFIFTILGLLLMGTAFWRRKLKREAAIIASETPLSAPRPDVDYPNSPRE